jgi:uncharacterized protein YqhQ
VLVRRATVALVSSATDKPYIGGQAVLEGVMMRAPRALTVAVRRPDGTIALREMPYEPSVANRMAKLPFARGIAMLGESMSLGWTAMQFSAEQQMTDEERAESKGQEGKLAVVFSVVLALTLFVGSPQLLATFVGKAFGITAASGFAFHALIGGFKLLVLLAYLTFVGSIPEMRRVFQYHGAEHMTIHAWEQGLPMDVENVRAQTTLHPRCGTTFLVLVVLIGIVLGSIVGPLVVPNPQGFMGGVSLFLVRVALLPVIASVSYEFQRFTAKYCTTGPMRALLWPGFMFQKITTRRPDDAQIEVAIAAMKAAAWRDEVGVTRASSQDALVFPDFAAFAAALPTLRPAS